MAANPRSTPRKRTTSDRLPATRGQADPAPIEDEDDEVTAAEAQEIEANGHYVTALLDGEEIRVIPPGAWRQSWQTMLSRGQFNAFAELVVHPDDLDLYWDIDPTNDQFEEFVVSASNRAGESLGNSRGPNRSSRRTRRR